MFDLSVGKMLVLLIIGLLVLGPDRLPTLAKDAARLLRSLHEIATGARQQLQAELGPELADIDLRSLHPRTVLQDAVSGEKLDTAKRDRAAHRDAIVADEQPNGTTPPAGISDPPENRESCSTPVSTFATPKSRPGTTTGGRPALRQCPQEPRPGIPTTSSPSACPQRCKRPLQGVVDDGGGF